MNTAYIFCKSFDLCKNKITIEPGLYIAADSGIETAEKLNITPNVIIGDFDSACAERLKGHKNIITYSAQKDDTDSMLAVKYALERGCKNITIVGGTGGRIDHTLANLSMLKYIKTRGGTGTLTDGFNRVSYISGGETVRVYKDYKYISILPVSAELSGVTLQGFLYNLDNACVNFAMPYTVSNQVAGEYGEIVITQGEAYICECD